MHCLTTDSMLLQKSWYILSIWDVSGGGNLLRDSSVRRQKHVQSALPKFQCVTGSLWAGTWSFGGIMREGQCCDRGNFPRTHLSGSRLSWPKLAKVRSGLVPTFHRWEMKPAAWVIQQSKVLGCCPGSHRQKMFCCNPSWHVGSWSHQRIAWGVGTSGWPLVWIASVEVRRRVEVNDLVSCDVYTQPLSLWLFWRLITSDHSNC